MKIRRTQISKIKIVLRNHNKLKKKIEVSKLIRGDYGSFGDTWFKNIVVCLRVLATAP